MLSTKEAQGQAGVLRVFQSKDETRAFYDKISRLYDLLAERSEEPVRRAGLAKLKVQPGEKALEIGFGTGHCVIALAQAVGPTGRVYGIDLSNGMREIARENVKREGMSERVELACGDATYLPYPDNHLDAIFMSFTLELFDTQEIPQVLAECKRVLKPGGRIAVVGISKEGGGGVVLHAFEWTHQHFPNLLDCRPIFVRRSLLTAGFRIESAQRRILWVPVEIVLATKKDVKP